MRTKVTASSAGPAAHVAMHPQRRWQAWIALCLGVLMIMLVNLPIGIAVMLMSRRLLPKAPGTAASRHLDAFGAITITAALILAVYAIINGNQVGWSSRHTLGQLAVAGVLLLAFVWIEARVHVPLMPLRLFRLRNVVVANLVGVLGAAAMFAWFFLSALYRQLVLGYPPLEVGLAFFTQKIRRYL
jgi:drug/metabolite transporter (DMT)-like permease